MKTSEAEIKHISQVCNLLFDASKSIGILRHISWPADVKTAFFASKESSLPKVSYPKFDPNPCLDLIKKARSKLDNTAVDDWLRKKAHILETSVALLCSCGSAEFFKHSSQLYGHPKSVLLDEEATPLDLADQLTCLIESLTHIDLGAPADASVPAKTVAIEMARAMSKLFAEDSPKVMVVDELSANALAGAKRVRIRRGACFTDKDVTQLIHHEAFVHVATSLNGLAQPILKVLAINSPASTKTQEGLAVFAELISGSIDIDRMSRLADRVLAIQMAIDGANFIEVYQFYKARTQNPEQSFENTRRVFRGGVLSGGAPFTKDVVYIDGLLRVHDFLKSLVAGGRADCLRLLFCGKLDIEDIPILGWMVASGICQPAKYLPPWASDLRFLISYLAYSSFSNNLNFNQIHQHHTKMLQDVPQIPR